MWAEPAIWDDATVTETEAATVPVTLQLGQVAGSVEVYDPLTGSSPIARYGQVSQITIGITDHPLIIEVDPLVVTQLTRSRTALRIADQQTVMITGTRDTVTSGTGLLTVADSRGGNTINGGAGGLDATISAARDTVTTAVDSTNSIALAMSKSVVNSRGNDTITVGSNVASSRIDTAGNATITGGAGTNHFTLSGKDSLASAGHDGVSVTGGTSTIAASGAAITVLQTGGTVSLGESGGGDDESVTVAGVAITSAAAGAGAITITTTAGTASTVTLDTGRDVLTSLSDDTISCGSGSDTIHASGGATTSGGNGSVFLDESGPAGTFIAGSGPATVVAGTGGSALTFGSGSTTAYGGAGSDLYTFAKGAGGGHDVIFNYSQIADHLSFSGFAGNAVASQTVAGGNLTIGLTDQTQVTLVGVADPLSL